jgi:twinfilin-like protein
VSTTQRGLIASIEKESIVPGASITSTESSFLSDLSNLSPHITPNAALYILLRRADSLSSPDKSLVAVTYVPNSAPVRQKMLFASTRLTLVRELGGEHFPESIFCTEADELTGPGWQRHEQHTASSNPLTAEEQSLQDIKDAEALESRGTRGQSLAQGGRLAMRADGEIAGALRQLGEGAGDADNLVRGAAVRLLPARRRGGVDSVCVDVSQRGQDPRAHAVCGQPGQCGCACAERGRAQGGQED